MQLQAILISVVLVFHTKATPIQLTRNVLQPRDNTTTGITQALLDNFKLFANFTSASYCPSNENSTVGSPVTCTGTICPLVEADVVTSVAEFGSENDTTVSDIKGYVALDPVRSLIVVAFAGSGNVRNWLADFTFEELPYADCNACSIHSGFATGWSERRSTVLAAVSTALLAHPDYSIVVTGHSLGAAVGTLAAVELRSLNHSVDVYTYGSPRVGNEAFAEFVTSQSPAQGENFRMTHVNDPVPQLPPTWVGYQHTSPEYWLSGGNATTEDYGAQDVVVCEGVGNEGCNAGTGLVPIDGEAHNHYLGLIDACSGPFSF